MNLLKRLFGRFYNAPHVLLLLTTLFWAGNVNIGRLAANYVPPVALGTFRWIGATLIILPFALPYLRTDWPVIRKHFWNLALLSFLGISAYNTLTYYGLQFTEAINTAILQSTFALMIVGFAFLIYGDRLGLWQILGMLLSLAGVVVIVSRGETSALLEYRFNAGDFILLFAMACYALYSALLKNRPPIHAMSFVAFTMGLGAIMLLPFLAAEIDSGYTVPLEPRAMLIIAYVVIFPSLLAHFFFMRGVMLLDPSRAAPFMYAIPVLATAIAIIFLGERLYPFHIVGFALVIGGVIFATYRRPAPAAVKS